MPERSKAVVFLGSSLDDLRGFPSSARRQLGYQLDRVQQGHDPDDWKPMAAIGAGAREIRVRDATGAYRAVYVAQFAGAVYVLHCFQKKSARTGRADIALAQRRYRQLRKDLAP